MGIEENEKEIQFFFAPNMSAEQKYQKIIELGKSLPPFDVPKDPSLLVSGCQSTVYIKEFFENGKLFFTGTSDALISSGLVYLTILLYKNLTPQEILQVSPTLFEELEIFPSLSPSRSNGLSNMLLHIKKIAVRYLI